MQITYDSMKTVYFKSHVCVAIVTGMAASLLQLSFHKIKEKALAILSQDMIFLLTAQIKVLVFEVC